MAAGYGAQGVGAQSRAALASLPKPAEPSSDDLARGAILAVSRVARAEGHPLRDVPGAPGAASSSGSGRGLMVIVLVVAAVFVAAALAAVTMQRRRAAARG